jgi:hypothetical protein
MANKWVLVETISMFRNRYMVEVPDNKIDWALDTVTMEEAKEFSQLHLGETIVSHRPIKEEKAIKLFKEDNSYLSIWTDEQIKKSGFTSIKDYTKEEKND